MKLAYRDGYDYQTAEPFYFILPLTIRPPVDVDTQFLSLTINGLLTIKAGYAWDGATGCPDVREIIRGSCAHDALYQLMREGHLPHSCRDAADRVLQACCIQDGMAEPLAEVVYHAVRCLGDAASDPASKRLVLLAPALKVAPVIFVEKESP